MMRILKSFIDPANYHRDAIAEAGEAAFGDVDPGLLIIRLAAT